MRLRIAPSPTGHLHMGSALTAVANAAAARSGGGELILRLDDTDRARHIQGAVDGVIEELRWLGIEWHGAPVHQSRRADAHAAAAARLVGSGDAYPCFCSSTRLDELAAELKAAGKPPRYDGRCADIPVGEATDRASNESATIRMRWPATGRSYQDAVRGDMEFPGSAFGDFIIVRGDGTPTYLLASIVDDIELDIGLVLRGEDHLSNTPRQLVIADALGGHLPAFGHLPLLRGPGGAKLGKRDGSGFDVASLRDAGHDTESVRMYLMELLGHGAIDPADLPRGGDWFDPARIPTGAPTADLTRLRDIGNERLAGMSLQELVLSVARGVDPGLVVDDDPRRLVPLVVDAAGGSYSAQHIARGISAMLRPPAEDAEPAALPDWAHPIVEAGAAAGLATQEDAGMVIGDLKRAASEHGAKVGEVLRPLRRALTGEAGGPSLDAILWALGPEAVRQRLAAAAAATGGKGST